MTRINAGIEPVRLSDQHLLAEYREIGRVSTQFMKRINSGKSFNDIPKEFTLGTGHQSFFLNKGLYTQNRFLSLKEELKRRNFNSSLDFINNWIGFDEFYNDWVPDDRVRSVVIGRIIENSSKQKSIIRYAGLPATLENYINTLIYGICI